MTRLYLAAPLTLAGYRAALERLRAVSEGMICDGWADEVVYPHGRTQPEASGTHPTVYDLECVAQRLLYGGGLTDPTPTRALALPGPGSVAHQRQWAELAGVPWSAIDEDTAARLAWAGTHTDTSEPDAHHGEWVREIRSVGDVLRAYFDEGDRTMGCRAMPVVMVGGSNPYGRRERQEAGAIRMAQAAGIIHQASRSGRWDPSAIAVLRALHSGMSAAQAALAAGYRGAHAGAERWALRVQRGAMTAIAEVLRARRGR